MNLTTIKLFLKFCAVGASGMAVDFGITWLFKEVIHANRYLANSIGFVCAATSNYLFNRWWTFESHNNKIGEEYLKFFIVALVGLGLSNAIIYLMHGKGKLNFYFSKIFAVGIVVLWNFFANYFYTFK